MRLIRNYESASNRNENDFSKRILLDMNRDFVYILFLYLVFLFIPCGSYGQNSTLKKSGNAILTHLYQMDSIGYSNFVFNEKIENLTSIIYGLFIDDSTQIRPSILTKKVPTCYEVMNTEIRRLLNDARMEKSEVNKYLLTENLYKVFPWGKYKSNSGNKLMLVLLYSKKNAKRFKRFYIEAISFCDNNNCATVIISLDPL